MQVIISCHWLHLASVSPLAFHASTYCKLGPFWLNLGLISSYESSNVQVSELLRSRCPDALDYAKYSHVQVATSSAPLSGSSTICIHFAVPFFVTSIYFDLSELSLSLRLKVICTNSLGAVRPSASAAEPS